MLKQTNEEPMKYFNTVIEALQYVVETGQYTSLIRATTGETIATDIPQYRALRASVGGFAPCAIDGDNLYLTVGIRNVRPLSKPTYVLA